MTLFQLCCLAVLCLLSSSLCEAQKFSRHRKQPGPKSALTRDPSIAFKQVGNNAVSLFKSMFKLQQQQRKQGLKGKLVSPPRGRRPAPRGPARVRKQPYQHRQRPHGRRPQHGFRFGRGTPKPAGPPPPAPPAPQNDDEEAQPPPPPPPSPPQPLPLEPNPYT